MTPLQAIDVLESIAKEYDETSEQYQSLMIAAQSLFESDSVKEILGDFDEPYMTQKLQQSRLDWLNRNPQARAGETTIVCGIVHVVSFGRDNAMQLTPVFFGQNWPVKED